MPHTRVVELCEVVINHIWTLLDQCYAAVLWKPEILYISDLIVSFRILIFRIKCLVSRAFFGRPNVNRKRLDRHLDEFERLQLDFQDTKSEQDVLALRRQKIVVFCQHLRWSIKEANYLILIFPGDRFQLLCRKQIVKYRSKVLSLVLEKDEWSRKYLSLVRRYKRWAFNISDGLECNERYLDTHSNARILEDLGVPYL